MNVISILQILMGLIAVAILTLHYTDSNYDAMGGWVVVLIECALVISLVEGSDQ